VRAASGQRVVIDGEHGGEGLALPRLHLDDVPTPHRQGRENLDVERLQVEGSTAGLGNQREGVDFDPVQRAVVFSSTA
jgi:hypothetical protein